MKLQSTLEGRSHRAWVPMMPWEPQGSMRMGSSNVPTVRTAFLLHEPGRRIQGTRWTKVLASSRDTRATEGPELRVKVGRR